MVPGFEITSNSKPPLAGSDFDSQYNLHITNNKDTTTPPTLFRSITLFCGTDSIPRNIPHIQSEQYTVALVLVASVMVSITLLALGNPVYSPPSISVTSISVKIP